MIYKNGSFYDGNWYQDKKEGFGKMNYENLNFFEGNWKADLKES